MIKVVVVDDHPLIREGITAALATEDDIDVVGYAVDAASALKVIAAHEPDVALVDVRLDGSSGITLCQQVHSSHPLVRVVVMTSFPSRSVMVQAFAAGAAGFVSKESEPAVLRQAVRVVLQGDTFVDPASTGKLVSMATRDRPSRGSLGLTPAEVRVLRLVAQALSNRDIAEELGVSVPTVKSHLTHAMRKLGVTDREAAAGRVREEGLT